MANSLLIPLATGGVRGETELDVSGRWGRGRVTSRVESAIHIEEPKKTALKGKMSGNSGNDFMRTTLATVLDPNRRSNDAGEFDGALRRRIVGQQQAVEKVVEIYQMFLAGLNAPGRPVGNLLFLGPTGSGKTRVVEAMAEALFGDARACIKIDCAEFQHSHEIAKLIGSPPGYLGHRETHPLLTQEALNQWCTEKLKLSILLFDEIEKASDSLWQLLLGILDKATLTLRDTPRESPRRPFAVHHYSHLEPWRQRDDRSGGWGLGLRAQSGGSRQQFRRQTSGHSRRGCPPKIHAGVHEPHRQDGGLQDSARRASLADSRDRTGSGAAARADGCGREPVCIQLHAGREELPAERRHRSALRRASLEARD